MTSLQHLLATRSILVVCGSGGVGKTTTAAGVAVMAAARTDKRVLVLTIDPARRLSDALGLKLLGNNVVPVSSDRLAIDGEQPRGSLHAAMLDTKAAWDQLVDRHAPDVATKRQIFASPLYENITGRFVQSHDYIAMERLYELSRSGDYDLIIIDTPPASHAGDFLDAPERMAAFFDSKLLKFLVAPQRSGFMSLTAKPFLALADRLLGKRFLAEISHFFSLLETMRPGFIARSNDVKALLAGDQTTFMAVTTLEPAPRRETERLIDALKARNLHLGAVVLNRVLPDYLRQPRSAPEPLADSSDEVTAAVIKQLIANYEAFSQLAIHEEEQRQALASDVDVVVAVPWFGEPLNDLDGLRTLGRKIWTD